MQGKSGCQKIRCCLVWIWPEKTCPCKVNNLGPIFNTRKGNILTFLADFSPSCSPCISSTPVTWRIPKVFQGKVRIINTLPNGLVTIRVDSPVTDFAKVENRCLKQVSKNAYLKWFPLARKQDADVLLSVKKKEKTGFGLTLSFMGCH